MNCMGRDWNGTVAKWLRSTRYACVAITLLVGGRIAAGQTIYPLRDGTIVDGGVFGPFDGTPDAWDWSFNGSSYEGAITLATEPPQSRIEHRVVWEYSLANVSIEPPVSATFTLTLRGAPVFPMPDAVVHVYAYPADLLESPSDFSQGPADFVGSATIGPFEPSTVFVIDASEAVNNALTDGTRRLGLRLQINPATASDVSQAFVDASDGDPTTKPFLTVTEAVVITPGDGDGDGDVDLLDFAQFQDCATSTFDPVACAAFDFDGNARVDLADFGVMQRLF
jgi:hypothetical protein